MVLQDEWQDCTHRILCTFADRRAGCCRSILSRSTFAERLSGGGADGGEVDMDWADYVWGMDNKVHPCLGMIRRSSREHHTCEGKAKQGVCRSLSQNGYGLFLPRSFKIWRIALGSTNNNGL